MAGETVTRIENAITGFPRSCRSYADVWRFLRDLSVPYCRLYDRGFTSLGDPSRTRPNEALRLPAGDLDDASKAMYAPAYRLKDERLERAGRVERGETTPKL